MVSHWLAFEGLDLIAGGIVGGSVVIPAGLEVTDDVLSSASLSGEPVSTPGHRLAGS